MQSKPKANSIITSAYDEERNVLVFTVLGEGDVELDLNKVHEANMRRAAIHGWNQRIPDAAAIGTTDKDGVVIPKAERTRIKFERMNELCRHYESGTEEWSRKGDGSATGGGRSITLEAIARVKGWDYQKAADMVEVHAKMHFGGDTKKALAFFRTGEKVKAAMQAIRDERALAKVQDSEQPDADAILAEMEEPAGEEPTDGMLGVREAEEGLNDPDESAE